MDFSSHKKLNEPISTGTEPDHALPDSSANN